jgi:hypothetical protein
MLTQREAVGKKYEEQNSTVKPEEARSEVCNLCSVVTGTFGMLSLFGVMQCYSYSKIKSVTINCNFAWRISNKSNVRSRIHKLFVMLPGKHATIFIPKEITDHVSNIAYITSLNKWFCNWY